MYHNSQLKNLYIKKKKKLRYSILQNVNKKGSKEQL